ncbi:MAG TPA: hypothetical protein VD837_01830 [Terriglobales bacterium]|nr:hypothetical protein [Terriglobales bacterium]
MKNVLCVVLVLLPTFVFAALDTPNPADYTIDVRIVSSRLEPLCGRALGGDSACLGPQRLSVVIDGKKYELAGGSYRANGGSNKGLLVLGTYKARVVREEQKSQFEFFRDYEFLLPDKTTRPFTLVGISE